MQVYRHIPSSLQQSCALAIGNFDGMHLGHQALLKKLTETAKTLNLTSAVMTFEPHPREFFAPESAPARLSSMREKLEHFAEAGVEVTYVCRFNRRLAKITPQDFMQTILRESLNAQAILVGEDFRFGAMRAGSILDFLEAKFNLISLPQVDLTGNDSTATRVSSTRVRTALAAGDLREAALLLNRPYSISGKVVHGAKRGRQLGFPTANVHMRHERPALTGVYAVKLDGLNSVANLGVRPTIAGVSKLMLEVHVLDFNGNLYDKHVHVEFLHKIRDEMKFDGLDALKAQIKNDVAVARDFFDSVISTK
ncbi:bifunctional riboflavin kinase/FAD synthetase [Methylotenera sp.]|uniref:bifunctional riboflavin kinase/FAD synthetase n=1 Tax=Methylotenera sp. TaxID=2051956 RepID=UPI002724CB16|nr:bifunctional riboflavin kinase/FAD synthetase [Methylotenera sp.]MDO9204944.1 bifunctional riboflavin kinase/FAD synthetase [Methylotenera sp.]MDP2071131.1 bifunctional riboflavin kinase/FAD synthetase [Methylotenera sp.]MDP3007294.1 bifunctional riboflavin kinase/FAD synthetase [Methylotenera sp.]MDP3308569.1 bifunctional riboflavin kinase/FAD synthetase [Methylotenera sp.]